MSEHPHPKTILVVHRRERRSKCSVEPLRGDERFLFVTYPLSTPLGLDRYVRIGLGGRPLSLDDSDRGLLLLDGTWKLAARMESQYRHMELRSLPPIHTAYPRRSEVSEDPAEGLATVEALYAALRILGRSTDHVLDHYHWKQDFLRLNNWAENNESVG